MLGTLGVDIGVVLLPDLGVVLFYSVVFIAGVGADGVPYKYCIASVILTQSVGPSKKPSIHSLYEHPLQRFHHIRKDSLVKLFIQSLLNTLDFYFNLY